MFRGRSKTLFIFVILEITYLIYFLFNFNNELDKPNSLISDVFIPHVIVLGFGIFFICLNFFVKSSWSNLLGIILYIISALVYAIYLVCYFKGVLPKTYTESISASISIIMIINVILIGISIIFAGMAFFLKSSWAALVGSVFYIFSTFLVSRHLIFTIPISVIGFIGYIMQAKASSKSE